jgi:hypothetical protein
MQRGSRSISRPAADQRQHLRVVTHCGRPFSGTARRAEHFCCEADVLLAEPTKITLNPARLDGPLTGK